MQLSRRSIIGWRPKYGAPEGAELAADESIVRAVSAYLNPKREVRALGRRVRGHGRSTLHGFGYKRSCKGVPRLRCYLDLRYTTILHTKVHTLFTTSTTNRRLFRDTTQDAINCTSGCMTRQRPAPAATVRTVDYLESFPSVLETGELTHSTADTQLHSNYTAGSVVLACNRGEADHRTSSHSESSYTL